MVVDDGQDGYALVVVEVAVAVVESPGFVWLVCFEAGVVLAGVCGAGLGLEWGARERGGGAW